MPIRTTVRGPAPPHDAENSDIIDETISFFRANVLFKNFDVQGGSDRTLIYLTLYLQSCLSACEKVTDKKEVSVRTRRPQTCGERSEEQNRLYWMALEMTP